VELVAVVVMVVVTVVVVVVAVVMRVIEQAQLLCTVQSSPG